MPTAYMKKLNKEKGISTDKLESTWEKAKEASEDQENFAVVMTIFKKMLHINEGLTEQEVQDLVPSFEERLLESYRW